MDETYPVFWSSINSLSSYVLFQLGTTPITPRKIILSLFALWFFYILSRAVERVIHNTLVRKDFDPGMKESIERFSRYGIFSLGLIITMSSAGINLRSLETFGAVLGVGLGFGLQNITQNFISGIILLTERPIKRGDVIHIDHQMGRVLDIRARSTLVLTPSDMVIVVPNSEFITKPVINQSLTGDKSRYNLRLVIPQSNDLHLVRSTLLQVADRHPKVLKTPPASVLFKDFIGTSYEFHLMVWISDLWFSDVILSELRFDIEESFRQEGISLPTGQYDVNLRTIDTVTKK